jgi:hypothetical protein
LAFVACVSLLHKDDTTKKNVVHLFGFVGNAQPDDFSPRTRAKKLSAETNAGSFRDFLPFSMNLSFAVSCQMLFNFCWFFVLSHLAIIDLVSLLVTGRQKPK